VEPLAAAVEGLARLQSGDVKTAEAALSRAMESAALRPYLTDLLLLRADLRFLLKDLAGADADVQEARRRRPASAVVLSMFGALRYAQAAEALAHKEEWRLLIDEAVATLRECARVQPTIHYHVQLLGSTYLLKAKGEGMSRGDARASYRMAEEQFRRALELQPGMLDVLSGLGSVHLELALAQELHQEDPQPALLRAIETFTQVVQRSDNATTRFNRGDARLQLCRIDVARGGKPEAQLSDTIEDFARATQHKPDFLEAYNGCGLAWRMLAETQTDRTPGYEKALAQYAKAIQINPRHVIIRMNRAAILERMGRLEEALADYETAQEAQPKLPAIREAVARVRAALGK
jgi:tetratricopeptide (TPR) repeat protein